MKTGIQLITEERQEQITKHGRTIELDVIQNRNRQLTTAVQELLEMHPSNMGFPADWDMNIVHHMASKPYYERLIIAGALIAAEIDRLNSIPINPTP